MTASWLGVLAWGVLVGLDLVAVPQIMLSRPFVAATVAGLLVHDPLTGAGVGIVLELFALDVLPVGAVRYPDYGVGAVAGVVAAVGVPAPLGVALGVAVGLAVAGFGELTIVWVRRATGADLRRRRPAIDAGDSRAVTATHLLGLARDALRALFLAGVGVAVAGLVRRWGSLSANGTVVLTVGLVGAALGVGSAGALRLGGRGARLGWLALGVAGGTLWVVLR